MEAIVLAGGPPPKGVRDFSSRGVTMVGGVRLAERVVVELQKAKRIERILLVAEGEEKDWPDGVVVVAPGKSYSDSIDAGYQQLNGCVHNDAPILGLNGDMPFCEATAVSTWIDRAENLMGEAEAELVVGYCERTESERVYPGARRTWGKLRTGQYSSSGIALVRPSKIPVFVEAFRSLYGLRKDKVALARQLGIVPLALFLLGQLTIRSVEHEFSRLVGVRTRGLIAPPCCGFNIDEVEDLIYAENLI